MAPGRNADSTRDSNYITNVWNSLTERGGKERHCPSNRKWVTSVKTKAKYLCVSAML